MKKMGRIRFRSLLSVVLMATLTFLPLAETQAAEAKTESAVSDSTNVPDENQNYDTTEGIDLETVSDKELMPTCMRFAEMISVFDPAFVPLLLFGRVGTGILPSFGILAISLVLRTLLYFFSGSYIVCRSRT